VFLLLPIFSLQAVLLYMFDEQAKIRKSWKENKIILTVLNWTVDFGMFL